MWRTSLANICDTPSEHTPIQERRTIVYLNLNIFATRTHQKIAMIEETAYFIRPSIPK